METIKLKGGINNIMTCPYKVGDVIRFRHDFISAYDLYLLVACTTEDEAYGFIGCESVEELLDYVDSDVIDSDPSLIVCKLTNPLSDGKTNITLMISDAEYAFMPVSKLYRVLDVPSNIKLPEGLNAFIRKGLNRLM